MKNTKTIYTKDDCYKSFTKDGKVRYWNPKLINVLVGLILLGGAVLTFVLAAGESNTIGFLMVVFAIIMFIVPCGTTVPKKRAEHK